ncbi:hypothetical protein HanIR_Chr04g0189061 [Helianthus annuus]|nr:hypothetical protein HanIR_Chr04g0189061 [Helianthus annuus]
MLRTMELERLPFEALADPSIALYSKDDPSDHLSDPSTRPAVYGYKYPCSVLCFFLRQKDTRQTPRESISER